MQDRYIKANLKYQDKLKKLFFDDIDRLRHVHPTGRLFVEPFEASQARFTDMKEKREYRFVTHPKREGEQTVFMLGQLVQRVFANIEAREAKGIDQQAARHVMEKMLKINQKDPRLEAFNNTGQGMSQAPLPAIEPREVRQYRKLMVEANAQLGFLKLPKAIFGEYENLIKMTHYDRFKELLGEDPMLHEKKQRIRIQNQEARGIYTQLQDGSVPSFEQFKAIKDQILKDNEHPTGTTPLAQQEKQQETISQFMKLEAMAA